MSLDCKEEKCDSWEEDEEWDVLTPSLEEEHEEVEDKESESEVRVKETESLKDSSANGSRKEGNVAGMLLCSCQGCRKEFQGCELDEPLGFEVGQDVTMMGEEEQLGSAVGKEINRTCSPSCLKASNLLGYETLCHIFEKSVLEGKTYNLLTPHFHFNMPIRLMERLVDMNAAVSFLEGRNKVFYVNLSHLAVVNMCCVLVVESFFGLNCLSLTMVKLNLLYPNDGVILLSTWESIRGIQIEKQKNFFAQNPEIHVVIKCHGVLEGHFQCHLDGMWEIPFHYCLKRLLGGGGKSEPGRDPLKPHTTGFRRLNQWMTLVWDYDLPWFTWLIVVDVEDEVVSCHFCSHGGVVPAVWVLPPVGRECDSIGVTAFLKGIRTMMVGALSNDISQVLKWLVMMDTDQGVVSNIPWVREIIVIPFIDGKGECIVPVMTGDLHDSPECDSSWERSESCPTSVFKDASMRSPLLRGIVHGTFSMTELNHKFTSDSESLQVQYKTVECIRRWSDLTEFDMKENEEDVVAMHVYGILGAVSFILEIRIPFVSNNQSLKLDTKIFEENTVDYFLKNSDGSELKHTTDVGIAGLLCDDLNLKSSIWKAENYGERIWCQVPYPFHYGKINCKMKKFQSNSNKTHLMQLITGIISIDAKEAELVMILKWELKMMPIFGFKTEWIGIINTEEVAARASSDKTTKDVFEWMIAWGGQDSAEFIR